MFYVHAIPAVAPFAADDLPTVVDACAAPEGVKAMLARAQVAHPTEELTVVETLYAAGHAMPAVPPELARAIDAWNLVVDRVRPTTLTKIRALGNYVRPYRKWKARNEGRDYLLEDVAAAVERRPDMHEWIFFGWLLRITPDGTLNSDKVLSGNGFKKAGGRRAVEGADFEAERR